MLRSVAETCRRAYTCSCHVQHAFASRSLQHSMRALTIVSRPFHAGPTLQALDSDYKNKKVVSSSAQQAEVVEEDLLGLAGFTDSGITIPTLETSSVLVAGTRYDELPIVHIKSSLNNTIMIATDYTGKTKITRASCGTEGFRNVKKKTTVAAQATGLTVGNTFTYLGSTLAEVGELDAEVTHRVQSGWKNRKRVSGELCDRRINMKIKGKVYRTVRIMKKGIEHVRVCVKGLGVGRLAAIKGLQMAGVSIVSLTDRTFKPHNGPKPRKARRV